MVRVSMDIEQFCQSLYAELESIPEERKLTFIKSKISSIAEESDRQLAETCFLLGRTLSAPKLVVVLIHGIRTCATWQELIRNRLNRCNSVKTYPIGYEYFDVFRFLCPFFTRKSPVEKMLRELRGIRAKHRNDKICVVAHSFGTYIISKILLKHPDIQVDRLLLCGSVIPANYRWDNIANLPRDGIVNECGSKDVWPVLAKFASWGYGPSGTFGFKTHNVHDRYHNIGHSDYFDIKFIERFWLPFILEAKIINSDWESNRPIPPFWLTLLSWFPLKWIVLLYVLWLIYPSITNPIYMH